MPAPEYQPRSDLVKEAEAKAGNYEWSTAARLYSQALGITETSENSRIAELLAKSLYKAARQSKTREEFDRRMGEAKEAYENASQRYSKTSHPFVEEEYAAYYRPVHPEVPAAQPREDGATRGSS